MSTLPRFLSRLLRRQTQAASAAARPTTSLRTSTPLRNAQTQAAPSTLNQPPPPNFQHAQHNPPNPNPNIARKPTTIPKTPQTNDSNTNTNDPLTNTDLIHSLRQDPSLQETRPHLTMAPSVRPAHFVAGSLAGDTKLTVPPYIFVSRRAAQNSESEEKDEGASSSSRKSRAVAVFHVGSHMCGHPGFVHGGFLSVMFDEVFAHCISRAFVSGTGMTANLNVDFRKPALPGRVFVLRAETVKVEGRKAWVEGRMTMMPAEGKQGGEADEEVTVMVAEARALFVEPRFAEVC
ncbi:HotDog domain-containing protein [Aspergillus egyptiacus]|nr:HotDog domain-containing protein [Aspergillus egyptiacus]